MSVLRWLASIAGLVGIAAAIYLSIRLPSRKWYSQEQAIDRLASTVHEQWRNEALVRRLYDPALMPLSWRQADSSVSDRLVGTSPLDSRGKLARSGGMDELARLFSMIPSRRLLILGKPGSGKTTLAITLILQLLDQRRADDPVPVLLPLATWDPAQQPYRRWLVQRLTVEYPALAARLDNRRTVAEQMVRNGLVLPVLDGLDEVPHHRRARLLGELNTALTSADPLVLTSRTLEYRHLVGSSGTVLNMAATVEIQPLRHEDIVGYLTRFPRLRRDESALSVVLDDARRHPKNPLWQVLDSPLMLSLLRDAYADPSSDPTELLNATQFADRATITDYLFGRYVGGALGFRTNRRGQWEPIIAERWLSFLAQHMTRPESSGLTWWALDRSLPRAIPAAAGAFLVSVVAGTTVALRYGAFPGLFASFVTAMMAGFLSPLIVSRGRASTRVRSFPGPRSGLVPRALAIGLLAPAPLALLTTYTAGPAAGASVGVGLGAALATMAWLAVPEMPASMGMSATLRATRLFGLATWVALALSAAVLWSLLAHRLHLDDLTLGIVAAAATIPWLTAGSTWGRFTIARIWYAIHGQVPWRLLSFLDQMHHLGLLRRSGGAYEFRHASLREVFLR